MKPQPDLRADVGQLLVMGFEGIALTPALAALIRELQPGGLIFFARNITTPRQTHALLRECRSLLATPPFLCVDMEGGTVDRLKHAVAPAPSAARVFAGGKRKLFREHGRLIGAECRAVGFNLDFAPCSDLAFEASSGVLGSRAVSSDPDQVTTYVRAFLQGLRDSDVLGCGKHFPGLGPAALDSHHALPTISKSLTELWAEDIAPYRALRRVFPFIMVAHALYPQVVNDGLPASLSPEWINGILRKRIGYRGLVISDDLEMAGATSVGSVAHAAVATLRAGGDLFLVSHQEESVRESFAKVLIVAGRDDRFARHIAHSAARVRAFKSRHVEVKRFPPPPANAVIEK
ncbi:MAG TPA: beta-N-acetylhexosaminidase, partial [Terriglobales bacterium]|nr:beta-N-acetylhexosaminidase [Terriglobales bacterium]